MLVGKVIGSVLRVANPCVDRDSGLTAAFCAISVGMVRTGRCHVVKVAFAKGLTNDAPSGLARVDTALLHAQCPDHKAEYPGPSPKPALIPPKLRERQGDMTREKRGRHLADQGAFPQFRNKAEPRKTPGLKTDPGHLGWDDPARLLRGASSHPADAWSSSAQRRVTGFERGLSTGSNQHRIWHAYGFYDPAILPRLLTILRFCQERCRKRRRGVWTSVDDRLAKRIRQSGRASTFSEGAGGAAPVPFRDSPGIFFQGKESSRPASHEAGRFALDGHRRPRLYRASSDNASR